MHVDDFYMWLGMLLKIYKFLDMLILAPLLLLCKCSTNVLFYVAVQIGGSK